MTTTRSSVRIDSWTTQAQTVGLTVDPGNQEVARDGLARLTSWAGERGLALDSLTSPADVQRLKDWAKTQGWREGTSLVGWAQTQGFKEGDSLGVVATAYETMSRDILPENVGRTSLAPEGGIRLSGTTIESDPGALFAQLPSLLAFAAGDSAAAADAAAVIAGVASPLPATLGAVSAPIAEIAGAIRSDPAAASSPQVQALVAQIVASGGIDIHALVLQVLREAYAGDLEGMRVAAERVRFFNDLKKKMREELTRARQALASVASDPKKLDSEIAVTFSGVAFDTTPGLDAEGRPIVRTPGAADAITNKEQLRAYVDNLETKLTTVGEDAQLANTDLQNLLQKQQQFLQTMSNVSRILHDTAMAVIRNLS